MKRCVVLVAVLLACLITLAGCGSSGDAQKSAEGRLVGHWVALNLYIPDAEGNTKDVPVPEGMYFDFVADGSFTVTMPSEFDAEGKAVTTVSYLGSWSYRAQVDPGSNAGFEYQFDGSIPASNEGSGGTVGFFLGDLSGGKIPNNPDALMFDVNIGDTHLTGLASINGQKSSVASQ